MPRSITWPRVWLFDSEALGAHDDPSTEFFALLLDPTMTCSGAVFAREKEDLESAQRRWECYSSHCEAGFATGVIHDFQLVRARPAEVVAP